MKRILQVHSYRIPPLYPGKIFLLVIISFIFSQLSNSQCSTALINWDTRDFLPSNVAAYTGSYPSSSFPYNQNFAIGPRNMNFSMASNITLNGENGTNTAHSGSFSGAGADVQFTTNSSTSTTITMTFDLNVSNVRFSMFDLDANQRVNFTATNSSSVAQTITVAKANAGSAITITNSGTTSATATGPGTSYTSSDNNGTINVTIAGPVNTIVLTLSNASGDFWLGDIEACVTGSFPTNYFAPMQPYTGQPTYIVGTSDTNTVSLINVATGQAKMIFRDVTSPRYINGLAYDFNNNELYYVVDFTSSSSTNKAIKKYNFNTETISTVVSDVGTIGIPTFSRGVESAGCTWYDGALYFGVEGNGSSSRENIIWRIDFDNNGNVSTVKQVWAINCGSTTHDWGDFIIKDSELIDFNSAAGTRTYTHYNIHTGQTIATYTAPTSHPPRQTGITWNGTVYWVYDSIAVYNGNGTLGARTRITGSNVLDWTGLCGDAAGFRPQSDFGDAPATFDPDPLSPALHMLDTTLRLGGIFDQEFIKASSALADGDGGDEDAIPTVNVLDTATTTYLADVTVYNHTGANATLIGWLDINGNGTFEASEAVSVTVNSSTAIQTITLAWIGINTPLAPSEITFLRVRLTSTSNGMTVNNPTGYYSNGEVEDYPVYISILLPVKLLSFDAKAITSNSVKLSWSTTGESGMSNYEIQRSIDGTNWYTVTELSPNNRIGDQFYTAWDNMPLRGMSFYRLKITDQNRLFRFSEVRVVTIKPELSKIEIFPNPVKSQSILKVSADFPGEARLRILMSDGSVYSEKPISLKHGENKIPINADVLPAGLYFINLEFGGKQKSARFIKK